MNLLQNFKINDFFLSIKLKKNIYKTTEQHSIILNKNIKNIKKISKSLVCNKKINFINYFIYIVFTKSNSFFHVIDCFGNELYFYSIGSFFKQNKKKLKQVEIFNKFSEILLTKFNYLKNTSLALFINNNNIGITKLFLNKIKDKLILIIVKIYFFYPYNGCRKKKEWLSG